MNRRTLLAALTSLGIGTSLFHRALAAEAAEGGPITAEMLERAEWVAGLSLTEEERRTTSAALTRLKERFDALRATPLDPSVPPALLFACDPPRETRRDERQSRVRRAEEEERGARATFGADVERPVSEDELAFLTVSELSELLRRREVSSLELTELYLKRLRRYDPRLLCVVTRTEELARRQAREADQARGMGREVGPLHGIPWGAKDLIAYPGYRTTWGAEPYREQMFEERATVATRLDAAGSVLVAKLTLGALAWGDTWFGGVTRNPWNPAEGSSGSSAGSASAVAAGLVGFALGSETLGSIVSPCVRCGTTGLRPTFGRVSRQGCMPLAWSMDKVGPIARSIEDCALVFNAIHGADGRDATAVDRPFAWPWRGDLRSLRVGYFESERARPGYNETLEVLRSLGTRLVPITLPDEIPAWALTSILNVEAATVFDELTRRGVSEGLFRWPDAFRQGQFTPAVEYLRANRFRTLLMRSMTQLFERVDLYVGGDDLAITNLTGHPTVVFPCGFQEGPTGPSPLAMTFTGGLFEEAPLLALAHAYQLATGHHRRRPDLRRLEGPLPPVEE